MARGNMILLNPASGYRYKEGIAAGTIKPGYLIRETVQETDPNPPTVNVHATAGGKALLQIAVEDSLQGKTIDDSYTTGEPVRSAVLKAGDRFQGVLKAAEVGVFGGLLTSAGDGTFKVASGSDSVIAVLRETSTPVANALLAMEAV